MKFSPTSMIHYLISQAKNHYRVILLCLVFSLIGFIAYLWFSSPGPLRLLPVNPGSQSYSLAFLTGRPTKACLIVWQPDKWQIKDFVCDTSPSTAHLLSAKHLEPSTIYPISLITGFHLYHRNLPAFITKAISETAPAFPEPSYGSVVDEAGQPVPDALVVVIPDDNRYQAVAAITNIQGNFAVDISPFIDYVENFTLDVTTADGLWGNLVVPWEYYTPYPTVTVQPIVKL